MAIECVDNKSLLEFKPEDDGAENATIFYIQPEDYRLSLIENRILKFNPDSGQVEIVGSDEDWLDFICARIVRIENITYQDKLQTVDKTETIRGAVSTLPRKTGHALFMYLRKDADLSGNQRKN